MYQCLNLTLFCLNLTYMILCFTLQLGDVRNELTGPQLIYRGQIKGSEFEILKVSKRAEISSTKNKYCADELKIDHKVNI